MSKVMEGLKSRSPAVLIVTGCAGIAMTGYSVFKRTPRYLEFIEENPDATIGERAKEATKCFWPCVFMGAASVICFFEARHVEIGRLEQQFAQKEAALISAAGVSEAALLEYKEAAKEALDEKELKKVDEAVAKKQIEKYPLTEEMAMQYGAVPGMVLFLEPTCGKTFASTVDAVRKAERDCLEDCYSYMFVSVRDFFNRIGSPALEGRFDDEDIKGWNAEHPIKVDWTFGEDENYPGIPIYVISYRESPKVEYSDLHGPLY